MECSNPQCNHPVVYAYPKFKIHIRVQDPTGTVTLTLFESDASKLLHKTANELMENQDEWDEGLFPDELDTLLGKKTRFQE
ncbi:hypothetical protein L1987_43529 [Smallanthus sonchifolius]|uniref:Uncharacterized protein n=1 Tax=Smallanthus sonchifolius TaxID=185202 RepID=A0ACB9GN51_9ASTR|nr:hypothetical protein L1987_43529 [Smallanthus sonchifolius]